MTTATPARVAATARTTPAGGTATRVTARRGNGARADRVLKTPALQAADMDRQQWMALLMVFLMVFSSIAYAAAYFF